MFAARSKDSRRGADGKSAGKAAGSQGPRPLAGIADALNAAPRVRVLARTQSALAPIQRVLTQAGWGANAGQWSSSLDPTRYFDQYSKADLHEHQIRRRLAAARTRRLTKRREQRREAYAAKMAAMRAAAAPELANARLFKKRDREYDDVPLVAPKPKEVKAYAAGIFRDRRKKLFKTQVMKLGGRHYVLQPGPDIGLTPALKREDLAAPKTHVALSRAGKPKRYPAIARGLDAVAARQRAITGATLKATRIRMGKDLDRFTRGNPPEGPHSYLPEERDKMQELAAVLRLDKGRVPDATTVVRDSFTSGDSFKQLLVEEKYPGAGKGGVERLRRAAKPKGDMSDGSDIE